MKHTYILCSCNEHKEFKSASLMYTFKEDEEIKVLDYIKANLNAFFEGTPQRKEQCFSAFFKDTIYKRNIKEAINSNLDIYAVVQQIPAI